MPGIKPPYHNKMKTPAKTSARITLDLIKADKQYQRRFDPNVYVESGGTDPIEQQALTKSAETLVAVGSQESVLLVASYAGDIQDSLVSVAYRTPNGGTMWPALHSRIPVANTVIFHWEVKAVDLVATIINDSAMDILATAWCAIG